MTITEIRNELVNIAETLVHVISELTALANSVTKLSTAPKVDEAGNPVPTKPVLTLEQVRAVLAEKSRTGHTAAIRTLLQKYGADKLSEIDPTCYKALLADAEVLGNG
jgi:hypothetical protein